MPEDQKSPRPEMTEFKGKPVLRLLLVDEPSRDTPWHWIAFGKNKAKAIVKYFEAIKKFAKE